MFILMLNNIVDKYYNTYHNTIKMNTVDVTSNSYAEYNVNCNAKGPTFKIRDHVRISKYKNIFAVRHSPNLLVKKFLELSMKKNCRREIEKNWEYKKELKEKEIYVKCKGYDNYFNSWINENNIE